MTEDAERGTIGGPTDPRNGHDPAAPEASYAREALRVAGVTLFVQDRDLRFVWVEGQARNQDPAGWIGRMDDDFMSPALATRSRAEKTLALTSGETRHWTHEIETDGEFRSVQSRFAPLEGPTGDIVGIIGAVLDLTEERRIEDALRVSEQLLRRVLDSLYAFVAVLDTEGRLLEVNRAPLEAVHLSRETVIGRYFWESDWWTSPAEQVRLREAVRRGAAGETLRHDVDIHLPGTDDATMDFQLAPLRDSRGQVVLLVCSGVDVTARKRAERDLQQALLRTEIALRAGQTGVWELELDSRRRTWDARMRELWGFSADEVVDEPAVRGAIVPVDRHKLSEAVQLATTTGGTGELDVEFRIVPRGGGERWIAVRGQLYREPGRPARMIGTARDITDLKEHDAHIHFLMREVVHRSKNLLAVIQAMARQTAATGGTAREFEERFTARLQALAGSHDLLVRDDWRGASTRELVRSQLGHYADLIGTRISVEGPEVVLKPEAAQNIGLALHELSTNAAKYGALTNDEGKISISWAVERGDDDENRFSLSWTESGGPPVEPPTREGFGHRVMKRIAAHALEGEVSLQFPPEGLEWRLSIPATYLIGRDRKGPLDPREMAAGAIRGG